MSFKHNGTVTTAGTATSVTINPLTPGTVYRFRVSAISSRGEGMGVDLPNVTTAQARSDLGES